MNYANPQEHVPEAERNNCVIKERFQSAFHQLPFKSIPKIMVKIFTMECAKKLKFSPPTGGISPYYSPRMTIHKQSLDFEKHCSIPFGTYVQAHTKPDPKNTQHPRTLDCIYLRYVDNNQGGHHLLDLRTGRTIKQCKITAIPITENVIDLVHAMVTNDNMEEGLFSMTPLGLQEWITILPLKVKKKKKNEDGPENHNSNELDTGRNASITEPRIIFTIPN
jgi:hypothetical protein